MAGRPSPSRSETQSACRCPSGPQVPGHTARVRPGGTPRRARCRCCGPDAGAPTPRTTGLGGSSPKERQALQTQNTSAGGQGWRPLSALSAGCCCQGLGTRVTAGRSLPPHGQPLFPSEGQPQGVKKQVLKLVLLSQGHHLKLLHQAELAELWPG